MSSILTGSTIFDLTREERSDGAALAPATSSVAMAAEFNVFPSTRTIFDLTGRGPCYGAALAPATSSVAVRQGFVLCVTRQYS